MDGHLAKFRKIKTPLSPSAFPLPFPPPPSLSVPNDQWRKKNQLYATNVVLVPLGDDFRYLLPSLAKQQFDNYERLFDYLNSHPELRVNARYAQW